MQAAAHKRSRLSLNDFFAAWLLIPGGKCARSPRARPRTALAGYLKLPRVSYINQITEFRFT